MKPIEERLGEKVAFYRKKAGFTQEELASKLGLVPETISRLERGVAVTSIRSLAQIASILGVELRDFFDFETPKRKNPKDEPLERLVSYLKRRDERDINTIYDVARRMFRTPRKKPGD